jgi:hypothetical protein
MVSTLRVFLLLVAFLIVPASVSLSAQQGGAGEPRTEDEWIVGQTARAVVDLARFVASGSPVPLPELVAVRREHHTGDMP